MDGYGIFWQLGYFGISHRSKVEILAMCFWYEKLKMKRELVMSCACAFPSGREPDLSLYSYRSSSFFFLLWVGPESSGGQNNILLSTFSFWFRVPIRLSKNLGSAVPCETKETLQEKSNAMHSLSPLLLLIIHIPSSSYLPASKGRRTHQ